MRVLVVEDERNIAAYIKRGLEEQGYAVETAATGREAMDWAEAAAFDLIVLDVLLPQVDGLTTCRELRQRGDRTPILMLTARDTVDDRVAGLDAGGGDTVIELTPKEYAVLECLLREPEHVLSRTQIAEHVWNYDVYGQSNIVDVYIRNLRRKIDDGSDQPLIQTVRGAGYRLSVGAG